MNARKRKKTQKRLMSAVVWGTSVQVARLLRGGADPNRPDRDGSTPLYRASVQGNAEIVRVLLAAGARPDVESGAGDEGLPLCAAAVWGHDATVRQLLAAGADPGLREDHGTGPTAAEWAHRAGRRTTYELLTTAGGGTMWSQAGVGSGRPVHRERS